MPVGVGDHRTPRVLARFAGVHLFDGRLTLEVTDDGRGIGDTGRRSRLANLRRRAGDRDGTFHIGAVEPRGTSVSWSVPVG